jgi:hypothetical protein
MVNKKSSILKKLVLLLLLIYGCRIAQLSEISVHFDIFKMGIYG